MAKTSKTVLRIISLLLSALLIIEILPLNAIAANVTAKSSNSDDTLESKYNKTLNLFYGVHSVDVGRAGTLCIDDYTLEPSLSFDSLSIDGNIFPVSVSMRYNSPEYRFLRDETGFTSAAYGSRFCTNYSSCLCEIQYEDETRIAYLSGQGSIIMFKQTALDDSDMELDFPAGTTKWVPVSENRENLVIYKLTDEYVYSEEPDEALGYTQYGLFSGGDTLYVFDVCGRFVGCANLETDTSVTVSYLTNGATAPEAISKIIDGVGNEYRFTYTDGVLTKIKCYTADGTPIIAGDNENAAPLEMSFSYANGCLTAVTFPDGKTAEYTYNTLGNITSVKNIDGYKAEITYTNGYISRISEYALDENNTYIAGNYLDVSYSGNTRTFTDSSGNVQIKTFDDNGQIVKITDGDGNILYGAEDEEESTEVITEEISEPEEETFISLCPCSDCCEWNCLCECENEEECTCIQCKRNYRTVEDESGNVLSEESFDGIKTMKTQNTYTDNGNYLASSTDTSGNTVYYVYDEAGFLSSLSSGDSVVNFDYDAMGKLTSLSQSVSGLSNGNTMANSYTYTDDKITSISHNGFSYNFTYDEWGNQTQVKINNRVISEYAYDEEGTLSTVAYANGQTVGYVYDASGNITGILYDNEPAFSFEYDENGALTKTTDINSGFITTYTDAGTQMTTSDGTPVYSSVYNSDGTETETVYGTAITYTYNSDYNQVTGKTESKTSFTAPICVEDESSVTTGESDVEIAVEEDWFGRTESKNISVATSMTDSETEETSEYNIEGEYSYTYDDTETTASTKIKSHSFVFKSAENIVSSRTDNYEYDAQGNITGIYRTENGEKVYYYNYEYDEAGQLVREDIREDDKTILYVYDTGGNIVSKTEYPYTVGEIAEEAEVREKSEYTYGDSEWKDLLTGFKLTAESSSDNIDTQITYDANGNVTAFDGSTYTWTAGRQLESSQKGSDRCRYHYNENGLLTRIDMYDDDTDSYPGGYVFIWDGDRLVSRSMVLYESNFEFMTSRIIYDSDGEAQGFSFVYNDDSGESSMENTVFLYRKNLQGDITGIILPDGSLAAEFTYDAYGNVELHPAENTLGGALLAIFMLAVTPQLYRGYIYVPVGGNLCYYLGSRFYSPKLGRFLNADIHTDTGTGVVGTNMFAYCNNNPVVFVDPTGEAANPFQKIKNFFNQLSFFIFKMRGYKKTFDQFAENNAFRFVFENNKKKTVNVKIYLTATVSGKKFSDVLYYFYQSDGDKVFTKLTNYIVEAFYTVKGRQILFSDDCIYNEIKKHAFGYWWGEGKNVNASLLFQIYGVVKEGDKKKVVKEHCETIDIAEADVYNTIQSVGFDYYHGIRNTYLKTVYDPYYYNSYRAPTARSDWKMP